MMSNDTRWTPAEWVQASFLGRKRELAAEAPFLPDELPFSFLYGGELSGTCLDRWAKTEQITDLADRTRFEIRWTDPASRLSLTAEVDAYKDFPAVDWVLFFENHGEENSAIIENVDALRIGLRLKDAGESLRLHRIRGDDNSAQSFLPMESEISCGDALRFSPVGGRSSNGAFPFFTLSHGGWNLITALGWTGQWAVSIRRDPAGGELSAGMEKTRFFLHPGERVRSPRIVLLAAPGDAQRTRNTFRGLLCSHYSPQQNGKPVAPWTSLMNWRWWNHPDRELHCSEAGLLTDVEHTASLGVECHWCDATWFQGGFPHGIGNWHCDPHFLPRGYKPVADYTHQLGLKSMIWFEPERVVTGTRLMREHPEFVHIKPLTYDPDDAGLGTDNPVTRQLEKQKPHYIFRLDDPKARAYLTDLISRCIAESGIDYYRNDFNINPLMYWLAADGPDRVGVTEMHWVEGLYAFWDDLAARHPGLLIDNCSSGGRRIDLETSRRSVALWRSDASVYFNAAYKRDEWNQSHTYGLSLYYPLHTSGTGEESAYAIRSSATAGFVAQFDMYSSSLDLELARKGIAEIRRNREFWLGDFHPLTPGGFDPARWLAFQLHRPDLRAGLVLAFRRPQCNEPWLTIRLEDIDPAASYEIEESDENHRITRSTVPGSILAEGYRIYCPTPASSLALRYTMGTVNNS